jgi:hypothetical protein
MTKTIEELFPYCDKRGMINRKVYRAENGTLLCAGNHVEYPRSIFVVVRGVRGKIRESALIYGESLQSIARNYGFDIQNPQN